MDVWNDCEVLGSPFWKKTCVMVVLQRGQGVLAGLFFASVLRQGSQKTWLQGWHMYGLKYTSRHTAQM